MDRTRISSFLACSFLLLASVGHAETEEPESSSMQRGVKAESLRRGAPSYPQIELSRGRQGWVELSYVVTVDGAVIDPVVQDSSGSKSFERAAMNAVDDWVYKPAMWNGEAVQQCETKVMITFALEGEGIKVSPAFSKKYRKVDKALSDEDLNEAKELLDTSFKSSGMTLSEIAWYSALEVRYFGLVGDNDAQLAAVRRATVSNGRWIDPDIYPGLLLVKTIRELEAGNLSAALRSYDKLLKTESELPQIERIKPHLERVQNLVASDDVLSIPAEISDDESCEDCTNMWDYRLLRKKFSLSEIDGQLGNLEIRCSRQRTVDQAREGTSWVIPDSWGSCSLLVFGDPGATFKLLEEPSI